MRRTENRKTASSDNCSAMAAFRPCRPSWNSACSPCFSWPACRSVWRMRGRLLLRLIQLRHEPQRHIQILVELRASIAMFVAMYCWNLLFSNLMMAWIPGLLGWPTMAVKIVTMGMQAVWGFLLCRYVIFKCVRAGRFSRRDHGKTDMLSYNGCASGNLWLREGRDAVGGCKTGNGTAPARV